MRKANSKHNLSLRDKIYYDKKSDALWILVKKGLEEEHREVAPGISVELGKNGELLGIEVLNASKVLGDKLAKATPTQITSVSL